MREIEVKARVSNKPELQKQLTALGCVFSEPVSQRDRIFVPIGSSVPVNPGVNVLRIREQNGKYIFTLKQTIKNQLDCLERELGIDNPEELAEIFKLLGFFESVGVNKQRQKTKYKGLEICLDSVEGLGDFIEVEKLSEAGDGDIVQAELFNFLQILGITKKDQVFEGYDVLAARKAGQPN